MSIDLVALPVAGAFIGYLTNYIAIKMLFYPKRAYYIFGVRVPFTPGLIPKKRKEIIDKISESIASNIVKKEDIVRYLYKRENREALYSMAENYIRRLCDEKLWVFVDQGALKEAVGKAIDSHLEGFISYQVNNFIPSADNFLREALVGMLGFDKTPKDVLGEIGVDRVKRIVYEYVRKVLIDISDSLDSPEMRDLIKSKIVSAVDKYADDSNIVIASLVSMLAPLIEDNEKLIDVIVAQLQSVLLDFKTYDMVKTSVFGVIEREILSRSFRDILESGGFGSPESVSAVLSEKVVAWLGKNSVKRSMVQRVVSVINGHRLTIRIVAYLKILGNRYSLRDMMEFVRPGTFGELHMKVVDTLLYLIAKNRESIFDFDIGAFAKKRLDALDISRIEDIVLNISKDQFKYIDLFGGLLGFIIGIVEVLFHMSM